VKKFKVCARGGVAEQLARAIRELRALQKPLMSGEVDGSVLTEFRDVLNRVRNTAWAAQQSAAAPALGHGPASVASFVASERIRAAYQLCRSIQEDVRREDIDLQKGSLVELYGVALGLVDELKQRI
jgi:hypothetical protein